MTCSRVIPSFSATTSAGRGGAESVDPEAQSAGPVSSRQGSVRPASIVATGTPAGNNRSR